MKIRAFRRIFSVSSYCNVSICATLYYFTLLKNPESRNITICLGNEPSRQGRFRVFKLIIHPMKFDPFNFHGIKIHAYYYVQQYFVT